MSEGKSLLGGRNNEQRRQDSHLRKRKFLVEYAKTASIRAGCEVAGVKRKTVTWWKGSDEEFVKEMDNSYKDYGDALEELADHMLKYPEEHKGVSAVLMIAKLNAHKSELYKPSVSMGDDTGKEILLRFRKTYKELVQEEDSQEQGDESQLSEHVEYDISEIMDRKSLASQEDADDDTTEVS